MRTITKGEIDMVAGGQVKITPVAGTTHTTTNPDGSMSTTTTWVVSQGGPVRNALAALGQASMNGAAGLEPDLMGGFGDSAALGKGIGMGGIIETGTVTVDALTQVPPPPSGVGFGQTPTWGNNVA